MKNLRLLSLLFIIAFVTVFSACKKDDDKKPASREDMLTGKRWKMTSATVDPALFGITDWYAQMEACDKDDYTEFKKGGQAIFDQGAQVCDGEPQTQTGSWVFNGDQTKITVTEPDSGPITYDIIELTNSSIKVKYTEKGSDGINYTFTATYAKM